MGIINLFQKNKKTLLRLNTFGQVLNENTVFWLRKLNYNNKPESCYSARLYGVKDNRQGWNFGITVVLMVRLETHDQITIL